jgi:hypothetical protein
VAAGATAGVCFAPSSAAATPRTGIVGTNPANFTPWLLKSTPKQIVRQLMPCGGRMYAVGRISAVGEPSSHTYVRRNAFSFSQTNGRMRAWYPKVHGQVNSIALTPDCKTAYLGGSFSRVNSRVAHNIVAVNTTTGQVRKHFRRNANGEVNTLEYTHGRLLAGGTFTKINGKSRTGLASMMWRTGHVGAYANFHITGSYPHTTTQVYNSQLSHSGKFLLIEGVFTSIDGHGRHQMAMLHLRRTTATLSHWYSRDFRATCAGEHFYAHAGAWSPDDSTVYMASTGDGPSTTKTSGLCDAVAEFPARKASVHHGWINYTGCDSLYGVVAGRHAVYVTGHERWANNKGGCDNASPNAKSRPGVGAMYPSTGKARPWNPTRSRGYGGDDMVLTSAGLWVASDNWKDGTSQMCGKETNHGGICFLPYAG